MIKTDSHIHPYEKQKSLEGMRRFVLEAKKNGFDEICFTEHASLLPGRTEHDFKRYFDFAIQLRNEFSYPRINLGVELDYHPEKIDEVLAVIENYPFDYVLGSVHIHTSLYKEYSFGLSFEQIALLALDMILEAVKSNLFDAISHLDFFRVTAGKEDIYNPIALKEKFLEIFRQMSQRDICLEINTSSLRRPFHELHPVPEILKWAKEFNLKYTFASDAHEPQWVGFGYQEALNSLTESQLKNMVFFRQRKMIPNEF
jgi:histidinol-phosphatase (PHP family)